MTLKELRKQKGLTQNASAAYLGVPLRTYQNYENDDKKRDTIKYAYMMQKLEQYGFIDESHGVLGIETIKEVERSITSRITLTSPDGVVQMLRQ